MTAGAPDWTMPDWPAAMSKEIAAAYVSLSPTGLLRLVAANDAPRPITLTRGRVAWRRADLDAWLARRGEPALASSKDILANG